ncbi:MAG: tetratricopeptide repeat protein [Polyangiales bacterium]|nr:tetratricopeptide repeat protein [Myxococcales bacterium]
MGCGGTALPPEAVRHNGQGTQALEARDLDVAEANFRLALEYHPHFAEPRANLGVVALERGHLDEAEGHLRRALKLNEDFAQAWANLGVVLEHKGDYPGACDAYERALAVDPGLVPPRKNLASIWMRDGKLPEARAQLLRILAIRPDGEAESMLAYVDYRLGRAGSAFARANRVLASHPDACAARFVRALARFEAGDLQGSDADLTAASACPAFEDAAAVRRVAVLLAVGALDDASALARTLVERSPVPRGAHLAAGTVALAEGRPAEARLLALRAMEEDPNLPAARRLLESACARRPAGCAER